MIWSFLKRRLWKNLFKRREKKCKHEYYRGDKCNLCKIKVCNICLYKRPYVTLTDYSIKYVPTKIDIPRKNYNGNRPIWVHNKFYCQKCNLKLEILE